MITLNKALLIVTDLQQTANLTLCLQPPAIPHDFGTEQTPVLGSLKVLGEGGVKTGWRLTPT